MSEEEKKNELQELDFVYCGRRWIQSKEKLYFVVAPIKNGALLEEMVFPFDRQAKRMVGGVYAGAKFSEDSAAGLAAKNLRYVRRWSITNDVIDWQARDTRAEVEARIRKLEADDKKISEIENVLMPLRVQYESYRFKRDVAGMEALKVAVLAALVASPRKYE